MVEHTNVLIPSTNACYLTIASSVFFFGRLRVPTRRCDLVVPAFNQVKSYGKIVQFERFGPDSEILLAAV